MSKIHGSDTEANVTGDKELRDWLAEHIARYPHRNTANLARAENIGMSRKAIDAYLNGTYFLPKELGGEGMSPIDSKLENAVCAYRESVEGTQHHVGANSFNLTHTWERLKEACSIAVNENSIVLVYGRPGIGKSCCLSEFVLREMHTAPISILCSPNTTPLHFVQCLSQDLKLQKSGKIAEHEDRIVKALLRSPRAVIADQANYLSERSLGSLCYIWEKACVPVIMSGTKDLIDLFTTSRLTESVRAQLASRISWHYLLPELNLAETKAIVQRTLGSDATDEEVAQIFNLTGGVYRYVNMMMPRILQFKSRHQQRIQKGEVSMKDLITAAASKLIIG